MGRRSTSARQLAHLNGILGKNCSPQDREKFVQLSTDLSPEWLYQDGERSHAQAMKEKERILREWKELEEKVGKKVTETDVTKWIVWRIPF